MGSTLVVTNDFPPRQGGIETFVHQLTTRMPAEEVVVYTSAEPGAAAFDATLPFPVVRDRAHTLLPTPRTARRAAELARAHGCDRAWFGAAAPLALLAPALRRAGVRRMVATSHGHEIWWARTPLARQALRRIGQGVDVVTYLGEYTRARIAPALGPRARMVRLVPGVDAELFRPDTAGRAAVRARHGLDGRRPVIACVSRLVTRKGQDTLIRALPLVRRAVPEATVLIVGQGPEEARLRALAGRLLPAGAVVFTGGRPHRDLPPYLAAADVFAMPCRTRKGGLEAEGLGIVYLEAAASGLPVLVGDSGGAVDAVLDGVTGHVVDGTRPEAVAERLAALLTDPERARAMGRRGRAWVEREWSWDASHARLAGLLDPTVPLPERSTVPVPGRSSLPVPEQSSAGQSSWRESSAGQSSAGQPCSGPAGRER
ncbi:glycosyltransferase family 4 protein [Allostreptomyces psammosilenae]|uniref:Phosphatidylinositol alpha-1,6-mannosyltransferase n=1 Tax=Allostreptomyces psammosilenae TaxID=1892865 RepID=A0A852ZVD4_9ACTN|nr:glycosyltransferase family 4 protein [Allostreptomyces psammosilenae]NYI05210.1 phosphatidylinositol alpha-1,6-mannosyltransferase [Allostreptomyces psammosilenae]